MSAPRAWADCMECIGYGRITIHPGARCKTGVVNEAGEFLGGGTAGDLVIACPQCLIHYAALDAAIEEAVRREAELTRSHLHNLECGYALLRLKPESSETTRKNCLLAEGVIREAMAVLRARAPFQPAPAKEDK